VEIINLVLNFFVLIATHVFVVRVNSYAKKLDANTISPADFSAIATNLPADKDQKETLEHLQKSLGGIAKISYVNYTYQIDDIVKLGIKKSTLEKKMNFIIEYKNKMLEDLEKTEEECEAEGINLQPPDIVQGVGCMKK
jgi:hypothetical protein